MKIVIILASILLPIIYCDWSQQPKEVNYQFKRLECDRFNKKFIFNSSCTHKFVNRSTIISSTIININPGIGLDKLIVEFATYKKFRTIYRPSLIRGREDACAVLADKSKSYLSQQVHKILSTINSNFLEPCPLKGRKYRIGSVNDMTVWSALPPLIPVGDWKIVYNYTTTMNGYEEFVITFVEVYEVTQKSASQF